MDEKSIQFNKVVSEHVREILIELDEDIGRAGLKMTPQRVADSLKFLTTGYHVNLEKIINDAIFEAEYDEMVIVKNIEVYSLCEHHLLPFYGKCNVAYLPDKRIIGLSKIPRIIDVFSRRLQVQERLTTEIASAIENYLEPKGVGVVMEAHHLCMMMRGVQKQPLWGENEMGCRNLVHTPVYVSGEAKILAQSHN